MKSPSDSNQYPAAMPSMSGFIFGEVKSGLDDKFNNAAAIGEASRAIQEAVGLRLDAEPNPFTGSCDELAEIVHDIPMDAVVDFGHRKQTYKEIARSGKGWKLHLNFDPKNVDSVLLVSQLLTELKRSGAINYFKVGSGGGEASTGHPGKEATVYVGHRDAVGIVVPFIEESLGDVLLPETETTLNTDVLVGKKIAARFENTHDVDLDLYGVNGVSFLRNRGKRLMSVRYYESFDEESHRARRANELAGELYKEADAFLGRRYGEFYTGSGGEVTSEGNDDKPFDFLNLVQVATGVVEASKNPSSDSPFDFLQK